MSPENIYNWILFINSVPLPTAHTNLVTQNPLRLFFFTLALKPRRFLLHRSRLCEKKLHQEMLTLKHSWLGVSGRGVSSSTSVWAASSSLRCQGPSQVRAHRVPPCSGRPKEWTRQPPCQEFKGDYFPPCLLRLVILKYLVSIKYKNHMLFKSRSCSFVYWKGHCGYYYCPQKGPFWGDFCLLPAPCTLPLQHLPALSSHPGPSPRNDSLAAIHRHALSSQRRLGIAFKPKSCWQHRQAPSRTHTRASLQPKGL